ncbi:Lsr2 family protein, partial [Acinetobacter baumannii]|nr:Lsr2 family protein [Acinetobacter baumannii]
TSNSSKRSQSGPSPKDVRLWAVENGFNVSERGRIPSEVMDAYRDRSKK